MLIERGLKQNDIVSLKLTSGEELVVKYQKEDSEYFYVTKPIVLGMSQKGMAMMPFMFTVNPDRDYTINKKSVSTFAATDDEIAKEYLAKTSGIALG